MSDEQTNNLVDKVMTTIEVLAHETPEAAINHVILQFDGKPSTPELQRNIDHMLEMVYENWVGEDPQTPRVRTLWVDDQTMLIVDINTLELENDNG